MFWIIIVLVIVAIFLVINHNKKKKDEVTFEKLKEQAEKGNAEAQYELGVFMKNKESLNVPDYIKRDYSSSTLWFIRAAKQGHEKSKKEVERVKKEDKLKAIGREKNNINEGGTKKVVESIIESTTCKYCGKQYDPFNKWAMPPFCSAIHRAHYNGIRDGQRKASEY